MSKSTRLPLRRGGYGGENQLILYNHLDTWKNLHLLFRSSPNPHFSYNSSCGAKNNCVLDYIFFLISFFPPHLKVLCLPGSFLKEFCSELFLVTLNYIFSQIISENHFQFGVRTSVLWELLPFFLCNIVTCNNNCHNWAKPLSIIYKPATQVLLFLFIDRETKALRA